MAAKTRLEQIERMLQDEPNDPELRYMLAMEHASAGNDAESVRCFQELVAGSPEYVPGYHQGGRALLRVQRVDEARALLEQGIPIALRLGNQHAAGEMQELLQSLE